MGLLVQIRKVIGAALDVVLGIARWIGVLAVAFMVVAILVQVFCRYILNNALPWPDEAARFGMLWMTGLMAPIAFRQGGFVAIETLPDMLPKKSTEILSLLLLCVSLAVLTVALGLGYKEVTGFGGRFATASLYLPTSLTFDEWFRIPRSWMMMSLFVGVVLLFAVNIELMLSNLIKLLGGDDGARDEGASIMRGAE